MIKRHVLKHASLVQKFGPQGSAFQGHSSLTLGRGPRLWNDYTVSSGTLNTTIPYHTIGRGPIRGNAVRSRTWELWAHLVPFPRRVTILVENRKIFTLHDVYLTPSCDGVSDGVPQREFIWKESNDGSVTCWKSLMTSSTVLTQYQSVTKIRNCFYVLFFLFRIFVFGSRGLSWHYRPRFRAHVIIIIIIIIIPTNIARQCADIR